jgi:hypothetical protein
MSEYVSRVLLEVNGQDIEDFESIQEHEFELNRQVKLMNQTGHCTVTPRYGITVEYVIPSDSPEFDFMTVANGTLTIDYQNGTRITYSGVYILKVGGKFDVEKEAHRNIDLGATARLPETSTQ